MRNNGLKTFQLHTLNPSDQSSTQVLSTVQASMPTVEGPANSTPLTPEAVARSYLDEALGSKAIPAFTAPTFAAPDGSVAPTDFKWTGSEVLPFTDSRLVNFQQIVHGVPVYGANVCVELDERNHLLSISSALGQPTVSPDAQVTVEQAQATVKALAGANVTLPDSYLAYYHDDQAQWHLVYVFEDVVPDRDGPSSREAIGASGHAHLESTGRALSHPVPLCFDYLVDAHSNVLVKELPRTPTAEDYVAPAEPGVPHVPLGNDHVAPAEPGVPHAPMAEYHVAADELGVPRTFRARQNGQSLVMHDEEHNVHTYDAAFADISMGLPAANYCASPPEWTPAAVSAHANACEVAAFLKNVLQRKGVDNQGGPLTSHVNCVDRRVPSQDKVWPNAAWFRGQMVYGQRYAANGVLRSYAASLDVVAHEVLHGVTSATARLEYLGETGALNESYSDIFGILVSNVHQRNREAWNWQLGEDLTGGVPLRDLSAPRKFQQPDHMWDYVHLPPNAAGDYGGVHINSGIHNKAAHLIMTALDSKGAPLFSAQQLAQLFYTALLRGLNRTSGFQDSRDALVQAAYSLFAKAAPEVRAAATAAIRDAFAAVGISEPIGMGTTSTETPLTTVNLPGVPVQGVVIRWDTVANRAIMHLLVNGRWIGRAPSSVDELATLSAIMHLPNLRLAGGVLFGHR